MLKTIQINNCFRNIFTIDEGMINNLILVIKMVNYNKSIFQVSVSNEFNGK